jgi:UDP-N-acetylglucosamine 2-epimerase (non-hydrolysing)
MKKRVLAVFGTRPETIKMLPVVRAIRKNNDIDVTTVATGQHRQMLQQVLDVFGESIDHDLAVMETGQSLSSLTSRVLLGFTEMLRSLKPHLVLVHGDTTTAMAAALASFYERHDVGHVEAGLRSFNLNKPWPEELNRVAIDSMAKFLFAPTEAARANLQREYNSCGSVYVTGNTGIDALLFIASRLQEDELLQTTLLQRYSYIPEQADLVLVTAHRRESFGEGFRGICEGLARIAKRRNTHILYPVHLNPNVQAAVRQLVGLQNVHLIDPVDYVDMVYLMHRSKVLLTDSGGIQEEGPALGRPVLVMRDVTERPEGVEAGVVKLVGTNPEKIELETAGLLDDAEMYERVAKPCFPYGDGKAAVRIADILAAEL